MKIISYNLRGGRGGLKTRLKDTIKMRNFDIIILLENKVNSNRT